MRISHSGFLTRALKRQILSKKGESIETGRLPAHLSASLSRRSEALSSFTAAATKQNKKLSTGRSARNPPKVQLLTERKFGHYTQTPNLLPISASVRCRINSGFPRHWKIALSPSAMSPRLTYGTRPSVTNPA